MPKLARIDTSITLYMPDTVLQQSDQDYTELSLTAAMGKMGQALQIGAGLTEGADFSADGLDRVISNMKTKFNGAQGGELLGQTAEDLGNVGPGFKDLLLKSTGNSLNPQAELMFRGTQFRTYYFTFDFYPRSQKEAKTIYDICQTFKKFSAPEIAAESYGRYFIVPGQFDITYNFKGAQNPYLGKISTCVLKQIAINYAGSGSWATMSDGAPVHVNLQMQFTEVDIMTRELIETGY